MARMMMALGGYRFSLSTAAYQTLTRSDAYRWPSQERIGRRPALHFVGPGEERLDLDGTIFPHYQGGLRQIEAMRGEAERGEPLFLVDGQGRKWGRYAISSLQETQTVFFDDGAPRRVDFKISLLRYGEDKRPGAEGHVQGASAPGMTVERAD